MFFNKGYRQERSGENEKAKHEEPTTKETNHETHEGRARLEVNIIQQTRNFGDALFQTRNSSSVI
jgi:hypothetical protein